MPGSGWVITAEPADGGSRAEMTWIRDSRRNLRGRISGTAFRLLGRRIFDNYGWHVLANLGRLEARG